MLSRCAFARKGVQTTVRLVPENEPVEPDWGLVDAGQADLVFRVAPDFLNRRLEDRVLDLLRLACCAATIEGIDVELFRLPQPSDRPKADELLIASRLLGDRLCVDDGLC